MSSGDRGCDGGEKDGVEDGYGGGGWGEGHGGEVVVLICKVMAIVLDECMERRGLKKML